MAYVLSTPARTGVFTRIVKWMTDVAEAQARPLRREIDELHSKTDRELADIGIPRDEIEFRVINGRAFM